MMYCFERDLSDDVIEQFETSGFLGRSGFEQQLLAVLGLILGSHGVVQVAVACRVLRVELASQHAVHFALILVFERQRHLLRGGWRAWVVLLIEVGALVRVNRRNF